MFGKLLLIVLIWVGFSYIPVAVSGEKERGREESVLYDTWVGAIEIVAKKSWNYGDEVLKVSPALNKGEIYVPYDISDAWRQLGVMLPPSYIENLVGKLKNNCNPELLSEEEFNLNRHLLIFLEDQWLGKDNSRLLDFFEVFLDRSRQELMEDKSQDVLIGSILCSFYYSKMSGEYPDINYLKKGIEDKLN